MDIYGQMPRPPPPNQQPLPEYGLVPGAYPHGSSGHPQELRNDSVMGSAYSYGFPSHSYPLPRKRRGNLPKDATKVMKEWFGKHKDSPYPTEEQKQELVRLTRLNMSQVCCYFFFTSGLMDSSQLGIDADKFLAIPIVRIARNLSPSISSRNIKMAKSL